MSTGNNPNTPDPVPILPPYREGTPREWTPAIAKKLVARGAGEPTRDVMKESAQASTAGQKAEIIMAPVVVCDLAGVILGSTFAVDGVIADQALKAEWIWPGADVPFSVFFRMEGKDLTFPMCGATRNASKWIEGWSLVSGGEINGVEMDLEAIQEAATIDGKLLEFAVRLWLLPSDSKHWKVSLRPAD